MVLLQEQHKMFFSKCLLLCHGLQSPKQELSSRAHIHVHAKYIIIHVLDILNPISEHVNYA